MLAALTSVLLAASLAGTPDVPVEPTPEPAPVEVVTEDTTPTPEPEPTEEPEPTPSEETTEEPSTEPEGTEEPFIYDPVASIQALCDGHPITTEFTEVFVNLDNSASTTAVSFEVLLDGNLYQYLTLDGGEVGAVSFMLTLGQTQEVTVWALDGNYPLLVQAVTGDCKPSNVIYEEDPEWDCETMGNLRCGEPAGEVEPTFGLGEGVTLPPASPETVPAPVTSEAPRLAETGLNVGGALTAAALTLAGFALLAVRRRLAIA